MFNSEILDVVIGLVFIYLLYSLFATIIQEIIATYLSFRSKILEIAIHRMLEEDNPSQGWVGGIMNFLFGKDNATSLLSNAFYQHPLIKFLGEDNQKRKPSYITKETFSKAFIDLLRGDNVQPGQDRATFINDALKSEIINWKSTITVPQDLFKRIKSKPEENDLAGVLQSLLQPHKEEISDGKAVHVGQTKFLSKILSEPLDEEENKAVIREALSKNDNNWRLKIRIPPETLSFVKSIWADAHGDIDKFKTYLESWFDETMERATGWYKKYTQVVLLAVGFVIAVLFNVNTMEIVGKLEKDPKLREQLVLQAENFQKAHPNLDKEIAQAQALKDTTTTNTLNGLKTQRDTLIARADRLVNGDMEKANSVLGIGIGSFKWPPNNSGWENLGYLLKSLFGWCVTALAISLGAPFWFDLLNKLMKLRSSVATSSEGKKETAIEVTQRPNIDRKG